MNLSLRLCSHLFWSRAYLSTCCLYYIAVTFSGLVERSLLPCGVTGGCVSLWASLLGFLFTTLTLFRYCRKARSACKQTAPVVAGLIEDDLLWSNCGKESLLISSCMCTCHCYWHFILVCDCQCHHCWGYSSKQPISRVNQKQIYKVPYVAFKSEMLYGGEEAISCCL